MRQNNKRIVYLFAFTFLGLLLGVIVEALFEIIYTRLLLSNFSLYSFGLSWADLLQFRDFFAIILVFATTVWGYSAGKFWWHEIYELKKFRRWQWFKR